MSNPSVEFTTSHGNFTVELFAEQAPITVKNFLSYVEQGFYAGTIFHRVIEGFMIQGGGFTEDLEQKATQDTIENEASAELKNKKGTIAMARTMAPHSATAQFFVNTANNHFLDKDQAQDGWGYAVFGEVTDGMAVVEKIDAVRTSGNRPVGPGLQNVPVEDVVIESVSVING
ncbi:MAG: peptidylprolyl isomerase [Pseudomonadota bacterium]|nr:peptidylprolyl isomerase [Pseudomonadota bacterium]